MKSMSLKQTGRYLTCRYFIFLFLWYSVAPLTVKAGLLLEPYVGIMPTGKITDDDEDYKHDKMPTVLGGRVGYTKLGVNVGIDYLMAQGIEFKNVTQEYDLSETGVFFGLDLPILFRAYMAYIFNSNLEGTITKYKKGDGFKVGVGFTGLPFVSLNLELRNVSYDEGTLSGQAFQTDTDYQSYMLSVSLPLKL